MNLRDHIRYYDEIVVLTPHHLHAYLDLITATLAWQNALLEQIRAAATTNARSDTALAKRWDSEAPKRLEQMKAAEAIYQSVVIGAAAAWRDSQVGGDFSIYLTAVRSQQLMLLQLLDSADSAACTAVDDAVNAFKTGDRESFIRAFGRFEGYRQQCEELIRCVRKLSAKAARELYSYNRCREFGSNTPRKTASSKRRAGVFKNTLAYLNTLATIAACQRTPRRQSQS